MNYTYDNSIYRTLGAYDKETDFSKKKTLIPVQNFTSKTIEQAITSYSQPNLKKGYPSYSTAYENICQKQNNLVRGNVNVFIEK